METQIILNEQAAGQFIGGADSPVSVRTLQRWRLEGTGPKFVKIGRLIRYRKSDLETFINECVCKSSQTPEITRQQNATQT